jgi:hypothetical protein
MKSCFSPGDDCDVSIFFFQRAAKTATVKPKTSVASANRKKDPRLPSPSEGYNLNERDEAIVLSILDTIDRIKAAETARSSIGEQTLDRVTKKKQSSVGKTPPVSRPGTSGSIVRPTPMPSTFVSKALQEGTVKAVAGKIPSPVAKACPIPIPSVSKPATFGSIVASISDDGNKPSVVVSSSRLYDFIGNAFFLDNVL